MDPDHTAHWCRLRSDTGYRIQATVLSKSSNHETVPLPYSALLSPFVLHVGWRNFSCLPQEEMWLQRLLTAGRSSVSFVWDAEEGENETEQEEARTYVSICGASSGPCVVSWCTCILQQRECAKTVVSMFVWLKKAWIRISFANWPVSADLFSDPFAFWNEGFCAPLLFGTLGWPEWRGLSVTWEPKQ